VRYLDKVGVVESSKCTNKCKLDLDHEYCIGCFRTVEEIRQAYENKRQEELLKRAWKNLPA
jgi:predicted Fe-S protein YdhL (DUF1289 family)